MNIEKLESVLHEMRISDFPDPAGFKAAVRDWSERIASAITEHLVGQVSGGLSSTAPELASEPGGHNWDRRREGR